MPPRCTPGIRCTPLYSIEEEEEDVISAPKTYDLYRGKYEWTFLDPAFQALQDFARENGFAVKKSASKKVGSTKYWQLVRCVHGGQKKLLKSQHLIDNVPPPA